MSNKSTGETATCPDCGRVVNVSRTRFGDRVFNRHMMGSFGHDWHAVMRDYAPGHDPDRATISQVLCPMSGQVIE